MSTIKIPVIAVVAILASLIILHENKSFAQTPASKKRILVDISHGQKFYNDPANMAGKDSAFIARIKYMTDELIKNAASLNAEVSYQKTSLTPDALSKIDLLFIHMPSSQFSAEEVKAIHQYLQSGGSLFLVMEVDYWSTLAQANVNDIVRPFDIVFKTDNPDTKSSGGNTKAGPVTKNRLTIPYHGARIVEGGTPFCFSNATNDNPFGIYKEIKNGGKIIAMGDGMVSLYMTSWQGVHNYQCFEFMQNVVAWLLK
jgi:hypothetical protein